MMQNWGEIHHNNADNCIESVDFKKLKIFESSNAEFPPLYRPKSNSNVVTSCFNEESFINIDPRVVDNIKLIKYIYKCEDYLDDIEKQEIFLKSHSSNVNTEAFLSTLSLPITPPPIERINNHSNGSNFESRLASIIDSDVQKGNFSNILKPINLSLLQSNCRKQLMKRSVALICINAGYISADQSSLDTLVGILHHFMHTLTTQLKAAHDINSSTSIFPDLILKVLTELGYGNPVEMIQLFKTQLVNNSYALVKNAELIYKKCLIKKESLQQSVSSLSSSSLSSSDHHHHHQEVPVEGTFNQNDNNAGYDPSEQVITSFENQDNSLLNPYKKFKNS